MARSHANANFDLAADGKFPADLKEGIADRLTRNPDLGVRALASQYFPRTGAGKIRKNVLRELLRNGT